MHANPADVFMDIVTGIMSRSKQGAWHAHGAMSPPLGILAHNAAEVSESLCQCSLS
jgi:hypothetical protein